MNKQILLNKQRLKGLYGKLILRLFEIDKPHKFIDWSLIYEKLGRNFSIRREEVRETLFFLRDIGFVEISCRGVKLNFMVKNLV